ncbi:MAG: hypothetical protein JSR81_15595 [Proteobacteria bacterium]|jgi:hypothetical protein|nr:hypothetical protein [Pseudomonadota bacterium]
MTGEIFDAAANQSAVWAVILGAVLATAGGFAATQMERYVEHRRRERNAALFFGELLTTLQIILYHAHNTHGRGDPFGPITIRMLKSARREIDIYDRNRESLFDLRHGELRARIQNLIIRITMPIEGVFDATDEIARCQDILRDAGARPDIEARIVALKEQRDGGYDFVMETAEDLPRILRDLEPLAHHSFRNLDEIGRSI